MKSSYHPTNNKNDVDEVTIISILLTAFAVFITVAAGISYLSGL